MLFRGGFKFVCSVCSGIFWVRPPDSVLTTKALQIAYQTRLKPSDVLFHSDKGTRYTSKKFAESVAGCDRMTQSMSRLGNCWDNAPTKRLFRNSKTEWMPKGGYEDITDSDLIKL